MKQPRAKVLRLTDDQLRELAVFYAYAAFEHAEGRTGMIIAQVGDMRFGGHDFIKVGFFPHDVAKQWTAEAGFAKPKPPVIRPRVAMGAVTY